MRKPFEMKATKRSSGSGRRNVKKELEALQSLYVRYRDGWRCDIHRELKEAGIASPCVCKGSLQNCHLINKKDSNAHKYNTQNMRAGCASINWWANFNNVAWLELWQRAYPEAVPLLQTAKVLTKHTRQDLEMMMLVMQSEMLPLVMPSKEYRRLRELNFNVRKFLKERE